VDEQVFHSHFRMVEYGRSIVVRRPYGAHGAEEQSPPRTRPLGIDKVIVNGTVLLENGELTGALPGQIIRGPLYQANAA
jgi:hypothetical protein